MKISNILELEDNIYLTYSDDYNTYVINSHDSNVGVDGIITEIDFQEGPVKEKGINGAQNIHLFEILRNRINGLNKKFPCDENIKMLEALETLIELDKKRTLDRKSRNVEGFNKE